MRHTNPAGAGATGTDLAIADIQAWAISFPVTPANTVRLGIGVEVDEAFIHAHPAIEGPAYA